MGSCKVYSWVPLQIFISGLTKDRERHEATSASQWHTIAINGADPFVATNLPVCTLIQDEFLHEFWSQKIFTVEFPGICW